jgi:AAA15 family ATPase/GTPase
MLLKYGARNFFCFKEGIEISLELGPNCPESTSRGKSVSNLLCVKGANGSGKTNVLRILSFLNHFCCHSFNNKPEEMISVDSFFFNSKPIDIYCDFISNATQYHYELSLTAKKVISETLSRKVNRLSPVFERKTNKLIYCIKEFNELKKIKLRSNASLISSAHQYEVKRLLPVYKFFGLITANIGMHGPIEFSGDYRNISDYYRQNPKILKAAIALIKDVDLGITDIKIRSLKEENGQKYYFPIFVHDANVTNNTLTFHSQSLGTQILFRILPYHIYALMYGGVLVMDEFDTDFHPHILERLVSAFDSEQVNTKNAQMIFSTHNNGILEYMGKYRTVLTNKESSESYGYRLDEIPGDIIRNDRPLAPLYNSGKIGGVPRI